LGEEKGGSAMRSVPGALATGSRLRDQKNPVATAPGTDFMTKMPDVTQLDVLAIFSHPDDAELTMAGTLIKLKSLGHRVGVVDLTRGEMGTRGTPEIRAKEALDAARVMGLDLRANLELPDGHITLDDDTRQKVVRALRKYQPRVVFTSHWDDPHPDHAATARIVREAARLASMRKYDQGAQPESIKMPALAHVVYSRLVVPSFVVDITDFAEKKMDAIRAYASQFYNAHSKEPATRIANKGFLREIEDRTRYYGSLIGVEAGEPFYVREALNVDDPFALLTRPMNIYS
jgi:bacillithiol biosynthesis deacetylase BshB1